MKDYKQNLQNKLLEIIKYIDKLCKDNNIQYYLLYGSVLGAVRHEGFIPWDDDIDIGMTYENYLKFIEVCKNNLDKKYFLQTMNTDKNYYLSFMKLRDITTTLVEEANKDKDIVYGAYVDIFPLVGVPNNKIKRKILEINRAFTLSANINIINNKYLSNLFQIILKLFGKDGIIKYCTKQCVKYSCDKCEYWCSIFDGDGFKRNLVSKDVMGKPNYVKFEDTFLPVPKNSKEYLKYYYGDYMKIPSKEEIKKSEHTPYFIDLNLPYKEYRSKKNEG